jgi:hypothetical protein
MSLDLDTVKNALDSKGIRYYLLLATDSPDPLIEDDEIRLLNYNVLIQMVSNGPKCLAVVCKIENGIHNYGEYRSDINLLMEDLEKTIK